MAAMPAEVKQFLTQYGFIPGPSVQLDDFDDLPEVTEEEASIFEKATGDYPMMHAKAEMVASRKIPGGTEYLFIAKDLPREERPDMPPAGQMKVYVQLLKNGTPEFTRVVR